MEQSVSTEINYCCFCHKTFEDLHLMEVPNMTLEKCFLEMGNHEHDSFKSCGQCLQTLKNFYTFCVTCTSNTQKIKEYCTILDITSEHINLYEIYQFLYKPSTLVDAPVNLTSSIKLENEEIQVTTPAEINIEIVRQEQNQSPKKNLSTYRNTTKTFKIFKCDECPYETDNKGYLRSHIITHKNHWDIEMFKCKECTYETIHKENLRRHMLRHKNPCDVEMFKCNECTYQTKYKRNVNSHMLRHKNTSDAEMLKCKECTFETKYRGCLKKHMVRHKNSSDVETFKCKECTYETKYRKYFTRHLLKHKRKHLL